MSAKLPGGYGYSPPYSPPYGSRHPDDVEDGAVEEAKGPTRWRPEFSTPVPPTSMWGSLLKSGYSEVYADVYDGIPFIFASRPMWTTRGVEAAHNNADDVQMSYALVIPEGDHHEQVCNRVEGLASGRALDMIFGRQQLASETFDGETLGAVLFRRPSLSQQLQVAVSDPNADEFIVDDATEWPASGYFYIGRECVKYAAREEMTDGSGRWAFRGCERGVAGMPHYHTASASSAYSRVTDVPVYWRGRLVTRYAHLVSPEGRFLGSRWCELGEFCRQEWRGYVRDTPRPTAAGMVITCLPIIRIADQEFGAEVSGKLARNTQDGMPFIVSEPGDQILMSHSSVGTSIAAPNAPLTTNNGIFAVSTWGGIVANHFAAYFDEVQATITNRRYLSLRVREVNAVVLEGPQTVVEAKAWFLGEGPIAGARVSPNGTDGGYVFHIPFSWGDHAGGGEGSWIVVRLDPDVDFQDAEIASGGFLALDIDGHIEVASYDQYKRSSDSTLKAFRIKARNLLGTQSIDESTSTSDNYWNPWLNDTSVRVLTGATGDWAVCLRTLMTSSGTGDRGDYDTLAYGFGLGLPDDWITVPVPGSADFAAIDRGVDAETGDVGAVTAVTVGKTSVKNMLCGVQALNRRCLVQRRQTDGSIAIDVVSTDVVDYVEQADEIGEDDILLDGVETPEMMEAPNHVRVVRSDLLVERVPQITRDPARAQAEGVRSAEIKAPGVSGIDVLAKSAELMALSDGQSSVRVRLPPWTDVEIGKLVVFTVGHPAIWDWESGQFGVSSIMARVVGLQRYFWDQVQVATFLLAGHARERCFLCPSALVTQAVSGTVYRVEKGGAVGFAAGYEVRLYEIGNEDADSGEATIDSIVEGVDYDTFTLDSDPSVDGAELCFTYATYSACTSAQQRLMFTVASRAWR